MRPLSSYVASVYKPKAETVPLIRSALRLYRVCAYLTGTFLLLLVVEMVTKYGFHSVYQFGGSSGFIGLVPWDPTGAHNWVTGVDLSVGILIVHGWFYVLYLFADFTLWSRMRWPFPMFLLIAAGGVVPFLSYIVEHFVAKRVNRELAIIDPSSASGQEPAPPVEAATIDSVNSEGVEAAH
jgi:integral membrane protein